VRRCYRVGGYGRLISGKATPVIKCSTFPNGRKNHKYLDGFGRLICGAIVCLDAGSHAAKTAGRVVTFGRVDGRFPPRCLVPSRSICPKHWAFSSVLSHVTPLTSRAAIRLVFLGDFSRSANGKIRWKKNGSISEIWFVENETNFERFNVRFLTTDSARIKTTCTLHSTWNSFRNFKIRSHIC
jgi:hypothetical protein